jgi:hypothetical protein
VVTVALLDVDPGGLYGAADELTAAAALVAQRGPARRAELVGPAQPGEPPPPGEPTPPGESGWATLDALAGAADTWVGYLGGLSDEIQAAAGAVRASADAYVVTDREADSAQRRAARGIAW